MAASILKRKEVSEEGKTPDTIRKHVGRFECFLFILGSLRMFSLKWPACPVENTVRHAHTHCCSTYMGISLYVSRLREQFRSEFFIIFCKRKLFLDVIEVTCVFLSRKRHVWTHAWKAFIEPFIQSHAPVFSQLRSQAMAAYYGAIVLMLIEYSMWPFHECLLSQFIMVLYQKVHFF